MNYCAINCNELIISWTLYDCNWPKKITARKSMKQVEHLLPEVHEKYLIKDTGTVDGFTVV